MANPRATELKSLALFAPLSSRDREFLASNLDEFDAGPGTLLVEEGRTNHTFFVIRQGEADVLVGGQLRRTLKPGDFFGEISMDKRVPATASIVARTPIRAFVMSHAQFTSLDEAVLLRLRAAIGERLLADRQAAASP